MKTESMVVDLQPTIASDLKQVELNTGTGECESRNGSSTFVCTKCNKRKEADDFHKNKAKPNGLQAHCKACTSKQKKSLYRKKVRQKRVENGFQVSVHGKHSETDLSGFSAVFADVVRELLDHEKL